MTEKIMPATKEAMNGMMEELQEQMELHQCPNKVVMQMLIAFEELYVNIVHYAYGSECGTVRVAYEFQENQENEGQESKERKLVMEIADKGFRYNPIATKDPDITLSAEERKIGGLGVFMAKKFMDELSYSWKDGENCLYLCKRF